MNVIYQSECRRLTVYNHITGVNPEVTLDQVRDGLCRESGKRISSRFFYDATGSELFEQITELPEYYQTRLEMALLRKFGGGIMRDFLDGDLVELGSGSNRKIRILLDAAQDADPDGSPSIRYIPVDISHTALIQAADELLDGYMWLDIVGVVSDFNGGFIHVDATRPRLFLFLGSTIGNLDETESVDLLGRIGRLMSPRDRFLVGFDMQKPVAALEAAYNDARGVTARFNKNALSNLNREFGGDFEPDSFSHLAFYNTGDSQIEMHLEARRDVTARMREADMVVDVGKGETIRTEISRKFSRESVYGMAGAAGLCVDRWFTDGDEWFSLALLKRKE